MITRTASSHCPAGGIAATLVALVGWTQVATRPSPEQPASAPAATIGRAEGDLRHLAILRLRLATADAGLDDTWQFAVFEVIEPAGLPRFVDALQPGSLGLAPSSLPALGLEPARQRSRYFAAEWTSEPGRGAPDVIALTRLLPAQDLEAARRLLPELVGRAEPRSLVQLRPTSESELASWLDCAPPRDARSDSDATAIITIGDEVSSVCYP